MSRLWLLWLILISVIMITTFVSRSRSLSMKDTSMAIENFNTIEMTLPSSHDDNSKLYIPTNFQLECSRALIKPNDCKFTNIIHFMKNQDKFNFVGVTPFEVNYFVIAPNTSDVNLVKDIPKNSVIYYNDEKALSFFQQLVLKIYKKDLNDFKYESISSSGDSSFINDYCNSYDINNNVFVDFLSKPNSASSFMVIGLNTHFDSNLMRYYDSYFGYGKRTKYLQLIDNDPYTPTLMKYSFFRSTNQTSINPEIITMDDIIYTEEDISSVNINKLIKNEYIDFDKTQVYIDVYECNIPDMIETKMSKLVTEKVYETDKYSVRKYKDSCDQNYPTNERSLHAYKNFRCIDGGNYYTDILYPFISKYDISLSELDFNKLVIYSDTFDGVVPIRKVNTNNRAIDRYKINVNPDKYPIHAFIDDIYYSTDMFQHTDGKTYSVLTNSIPFAYDTDTHEIVSVVKNNEVSYFIKSIANLDITANFTTTNGESKTVVLQEGDRVFLKNDSIADSRLSSFLANKLQIEGKNFYHGTVTVGKSIVQDNKPYNKTVIKLFNIRKNENIQGACFDSKWEATSDKMVSITTKEECESKNMTWDVPCKYNHECPFYRKNKNYHNFRGGCLSSGFCEMPVGVKLRSFRKFEENSKDSYPVCYNCGSDVQDPHCCDEQEKLSKKENTQFKSADYLFYNDSGDRKEMMFQDGLECNKNSLKINKYI